MRIALYLKNYSFSKDYVALTYLARKHSIIVVKCGEWIGKTMYNTEIKDFTVVSENGEEKYLYALSSIQFRAACEAMDLKFLFPRISVEDQQAIENLKQIDKILEE